MNDLERIPPDNPEQNAAEKPPEECHSPEEFNRSLQARQEKLEGALDRSARFQSYADGLAERYSPEELLKAKQELGDPDALKAAYQDAYLGNHDGMSSEALGEMRMAARGNWENYQFRSHIYDMALDRLGYQPDPNSASADFIPVDYPSAGFDSVGVRSGPDQAIDNVVKNAGFQTHPHAFVSDGTPDGVKKDLVNSIEGAGTVPAPLKNREGIINGFAGQMIESGENIQERKVTAGESFVRFCANDDSGRSPYFTSMESIKDIACHDRNGTLFLNEDRFRDRFSLPENSKLEQCEIYAAKDDFSAYVSKVAPSSEYWGQVNHFGGGEQILIADRSHLEKRDSQQVMLCSDEEFQKKKAEEDNRIS